MGYKKTEWRKLCKPLFGKYYDTTIGDMLNVSSSSVQEYRVSLNIPPLPPPDHPHKVDIDNHKSIIGKATDAHLAEFIGCSSKVVRTRRLSLGLDSFEKLLVGTGNNFIRRESLLHVAEDICCKRLYNRYYTPKGLFLSGTSVAIAHKDIRPNKRSVFFRDNSNKDWYVDEVLRNINC